MMRPTIATSACLLVLCLPQIKAEVILTTVKADGGVTASKYCQENPAQAAVPCGPTSTPTSAAPVPGFHITPTGTVHRTYVGGVFENKLFIGHDDATWDLVVPNGALYAVDITTGQRAWTADLSSSLSRIVSEGSYHEGLVYWAGYGPAGSPSYVYALHEQTGAVAWTYDMAANGFNSYGSANHGVTIADGKVIVATSPYGNVFALDATSGAEVWLHPHFSSVWGEGVSSLPAVGDGKLFFSADTKRLYALDLTTGTDLWSYTLDCQSRSGPAYHNGVVYVGDGYGCTDPKTSHVYAINAETGIATWKVTLAGDIIYGADIIYDNGMLFVGQYYYGALHALDASDGATIWTFNTGSNIDRDMIVDNGVLYLGTRGKVYALHTATGVQKWEFAFVGTNRPTSMKLNGGNLYFATYEGHIYSLNTATGLLV